MARPEEPACQEREGGIQEGIIQSVNECHSDYSNLLLENIVISGGNTKFPTFKDRIKSEIAPLVDHYLVRDMKIFDHQEVEPVIEGMKLFARNEELLKDVAIYKHQYDEIGFNIIWKTCY